MIKLSIIIPYHNEDSLRDTLYFLNLQQVIDYSEIEILIINNCYKPISIESFVEGLDKIKSAVYYYNVPGDNGPGPSQQFGINIARGDYVMILDCGDLIYSVLSLHNVLEYIQTNKDYYSFEFINTTPTSMHRDGGKNLSYSVAWDKVYNKKFLLDNGICFAPDILYAEDVHFTKLLLSIPANWEGIDEPLYIHLLNYSSLGNSQFNNKDNFKRYIKDVIRSNEIEFEFVKAHNIDKDVVTPFCPYPFWYMQQYLVEHPEDYEEIDNYVCSLWKEYILKYNPSLKFPNAENCINYIEETYVQFIKRNFSEADL